MSNNINTTDVVSSPPATQTLFRFVNMRNPELAKKKET
jgi:hypothetical protein